MEKQNKKVAASGGWGVRINAEEVWTFQDNVYTVIGPWITQVYALLKKHLMCTFHM